MPPVRGFTKEVSQKMPDKHFLPSAILFEKLFGTRANNSRCKYHLCNKLKHHAKAAHLIDRWTPSEAGATRAAPAATRARLYRARLPRRKRAGRWTRVSTA